ncbi:hypothetical protein [Phytohalomonas tamaricis]|uniref:hypothetical protein n=1 Tax=Phytohalomonas tamaricis TaxID=2081032 RepID=UPI000D0AF617|nr:hypothetical protein [Phytohalomonas tamaricis]
MTSVRTLPSVPHVLPNAVRASNSPLPMGATPDFPSLLKVQAEPTLSPPGPANTWAQPEQAVNMPRRQDVDAMLLQLLASQKMLLPTVGRAGRSMPGISDSGVTIPDCDFLGDTPAESTDAIDLAFAREHSAVQCIEHMHIKDPTTLRAEHCTNDRLYDVPVECAPQLSSADVALLQYIVIWIPAEIVRFPMQSVRGRPRRRIKPRLHPSLKIT